MTVSLPVTTSTFGNQSLVVLTTKPADLTAITAAAITAGINISCHEVGDWWPTATTNKVSLARKMCQTNTVQTLGETVHDAPALQYTYIPQLVQTPASAGNEAYEALPPGVSRYLVQRIGKGGTTVLASGDAYRVLAVETGPQVPAASANDASGEAVINQELGFLGGYAGPVSGVIV